MSRIRSRIAVSSVGCTIADQPFVIANPARYAALAERSLTGGRTPVIELSTRALGPPQ
jgi:hypothetical protein